MGLLRLNLEKAGGTAKEANNAKTEELAEDADLTLQMNRASSLKVSRFELPFLG